MDEAITEPARPGPGHLPADAHRPRPRCGGDGHRPPGADARHRGRRHGQASRPVGRGGRLLLLVEALQNASRHGGRPPPSSITADRRRRGPAWRRSATRGGPRPGGRGPHGGLMNMMDRGGRRGRHAHHRQRGGVPVRACSSRSPARTAPARGMQTPTPIHLPEPLSAVARCGSWGPERLTWRPVAAGGTGRWMPLRPLEEPASPFSSPCARRLGALRRSRPRRGPTPARRAPPPERRRRLPPGDHPARCPAPDPCVVANCGAAVLATMPSVAPTKSNLAHPSITASSRIFVLTVDAEGEQAGGGSGGLPGLRVAATVGGGRNRHARPLVERHRTARRPLQLPGDHHPSGPRSLPFWAGSASVPAGDPNVGVTLDEAPPADTRPPDRRR